MHFTISRSSLLGAIDKCLAVVPGGHHAAAFNVMRVEPKRTKVRFAAVGELASVDTVADGEVKSTGSFNVIPKHLRDIATAMPEGRMELSIKGTRVTVRSLMSTRKVSFESSTVDPIVVDDPGKDAAWLEISARELSAGLAAVKTASKPRTDDAAAWLLVPTEQGLDIGASNGQLVGIVHSRIRMPVDTPIVVPEMAGVVLDHMVEDDDKVRLFASERRLYFENCDTLVSAAIPALYRFRDNHKHAYDLIQGDDRTVGPVFDPVLLQRGVKAVLALGGFRDKDERDRGFSLSLKLGPHACAVELALGAADGKDEFDCEEEGAEIECRVDSEYLLGALGGFAPNCKIRAYYHYNALILESDTAVFAMAVLETRR